MQANMTGQSVSIGTYFPDGGDVQAPSDVAVVIPTVLRPAIIDAVNSVYGQSGVGRVQLMIGVDKAIGPIDQLNAALSQRPSHVSATVLHLPYSTSIRHGGVHRAKDGGSLRSMLTFMANSRYVAYLDDDNQWEPGHLAGLLAAVQGKVWAHSMRMLIDQDSGEEMAVDRWDSVGVGKGRFAPTGGFVDPNCLLIDKVAATRALSRWSEGPIADRQFFAAIKAAPHGRVNEPTARYFVRTGRSKLANFLRDGVEF